MSGAAITRPHPQRTLAAVGHAKICEAELANVVLERDTLGARIGLGDKGRDVGEVLARACGHIVVDGGQRAIGPAHDAVRIAAGVEM